MHAHCSLGVEGAAESSNIRRRRPPVPRPEGLPKEYEVRMTEQGQLYFLHVPSGVSTWHDPRIPRNVDLIGLLSGSEEGRSLDNILGPLPSGWERRETSSGRPYFVDHANQVMRRLKILIFFKESCNLGY